MNPLSTSSGQDQDEENQLAGFVFPERDPGLVRQGLGSEAVPENDMTFRDGQMVSRPQFDELDTIMDIVDISNIWDIILDIRSVEVPTHPASS